MEIRLAKETDQVQIQKYDHIPADRLARCIRDGLVNVLCHGKQVIGVLRFSLFWQTVPFLDLLYIDETYRGQGWGRQMMSHWEKAMKKQGYAYGMLSTQEDETAKFFYEKLGYIRIGAFAPPEQEADEIVYMKYFKV